MLIGRHCKESHWSCGAQLVVCFFIVSESYSYKIRCDKCLLWWWRHEMDTLSRSLVLCEENPPVAGRFPWQRVSDAKLWGLFWGKPEKTTVELTVDVVEIWDAMTLTCTVMLSAYSMACSKVCDSIKTVLVMKFEYSGYAGWILWLLMFWPFRRQDIITHGIGYVKRNGAYVFPRKDFNVLYHLVVKKWQKMQIHFHVTKNRFSREVGPSVEHW